LNCSNNKIKELKLNDKLKELNCSSNKITELKLNNNLILFIRRKKFGKKWESFAVVSSESRYYVGQCNSLIVY